jgi:hypothetical protein
MQDSFVQGLEDGKEVVILRLNHSVVSKLPSDSKLSLIHSPASATPSEAQNGDVLCILLGGERVGYFEVRRYPVFPSRTLLC